MTQEQIARLMSLLEEEMSLIEVAGELGMSYHSFRIRLAESGFRIVRRLEPIRPVALPEREREAVAA